MSEYIEPGAEDLPGPEELPDAAWLARLQTLIRESAAGGPTATEFAERLLVQGARLIAQTSRSGRVSGVSYEYEGHVVKGSMLGPAYTWSGLQKKLGVTYVRQRDQVAMEGRLELPVIPPQGESREVERQPPLPWDGDESEARTRPADEHGELYEISKPDQPPVAGESEMPHERGDLADDTGSQHPVEEPAAAPPFPAPTAQVQAVDAEPWEEWAAELDQEAGESDLQSREASSLGVSGMQGEISAAQTASAVPAGTVTVETEQWQALVSAVGELRDQVRAWDMRLADAASEHASAGENDAMREQMAALTGIVRQASQAAQQATEAMNRAKHESLWLSITSASVAGLLAALLVGLWFSQSAAQRVDEMQQALIEHMEKQAAEDPLRQYFDRIVKKLQQP